jgi:hypothetical protein
MRLSSRGGGDGRLRFAWTPPVAGVLLAALVSVAGVEAAVALTPRPGGAPTDVTGSARAPVATPPPCVVKIVDYVFHPPQVVVNGGTTVLALEVANCTQQAQQVAITESGAEPPGCPVLDPVARHVTIAAGAAYRHSLRMSDPSCTGLEHMSASVTGATGSVLASRSAYLTVIPADATRVYASDGGRHYRVTAGTTLGVSLWGPSGFTWTEPVSSNAKVLGRSGGAGGSSASAVFVAKATGKASVTAVDNPNCYPLCEVASKLFEIAVTVVPKKPASASR